MNRIILLAQWALVCLLSVASASARIVDRIMAQVNDDIITLSDVNREMSRLRAQMQTQYAGEELEAQMKNAEQGVLDDLIQNKLLLQKANEYGFGAQVDPQVSAYIQRLIEENNLGGIENFEKALQQQGMTLAAFREDINRQITIQNLIREFVANRITVLTEEIEKYYRQHADEFTAPAEVSLSEIVIPVDGGESAARSKANDIHRRLSQGEAFATLASQFSKGATASKGGSIGVYVIEKLNEDIAGAIADVQEGGVTPVLETPEGIVLYKVDSRKEATLTPLEEVREEIHQRIFNQKFNPELARFVTRIKEEAYIQIFSESGSQLEN